MGAGAAVEAALAADGMQAGAPLPPPSPPLPPHRWAQRSVHARSCRRPGFTLALEGHARLPLPPPLLFELLTHPENAAILRSLDRCSLRRVLADDGAGRLTVAVEQETTCHFLFYTGTVRTPLLVEQDAAAGAMTYRVPRKAECSLFDGEAGTCGHLAALEGSWRVEADGPCGSVLHFAQAVSPRGLPPLLGGAVRSFALAQVRGTCEDLYAEALRIQAGRPTLPLSSLYSFSGQLPTDSPLALPLPGGAGTACSADGQALPGKLSLLPAGEADPSGQADPASVLDRPSASASSSSNSSEDGSTAGTRPRASLDSFDGSNPSPFASASNSTGDSDSASGCSRGGRAAVAAVVASCAAGPGSYPLPLQRLLSAASGCLDGCRAVVAPSPPTRPKQKQAALPASSRSIMECCPAWLLAAAAAMLCLLAALLRALEAAVRAELQAAEAWAARLAAAAQERESSSS